MPISADHPLEAYIRSVEAEAKAQVCSLHVSTFAAEFDRRYQAWRVANAAALAEGEAAAARGIPNANGPSVKVFARMGADLLEALPEDDRLRRCNELLALFTERQAK